MIVIVIVSRTREYENNLEKKNKNKMEWDEGACYVPFAWSDHRRPRGRRHGRADEDEIPDGHWQRDNSIRVRDAARSTWIHTAGRVAPTPLLRGGVDNTPPHYPRGLLLTREPPSQSSQSR